jgi:DNA-binding FrmR family transcriptional regulator
MSEDDGKRLLDRLARIEGQIRGVRNMLESDRTCEDVLTQLLAARAGLEKASLIMIERHLEDCVIGAGTLDDESWAKLREALQMVHRHS